METHRLPAAPSPAERAAVDALLGPPPAPSAGADGGPERSAGGRPRRARERRRLLLPALHAVQDAVGWISAGALGYVCERLPVPPAEAYGVAASYALLSTRERPPRVAHLCDDIVCRGAGADALAAGVERALSEGGEGEAAWEPSPCLGLCERAPAAFLRIAGGGDRVLAPARAADVAAALRGGEGDGGPAPAAVAAPQTAPPRADGLRLLARAGLADPSSLDDYRAHGGYEALRAALELGPERMIRELEDSRLLGRGGAAFPAGRKWRDVAHAASPVRYVVCNADESEPGAFKDRVLMEHDPFALVEALTIAGVTTGAERGYLYLRREYPHAAARLASAIAQAGARGLLGADVLGSGRRFEVEIRRGAGAYVCGEETALFNSIEGRRGEPRSKPPWPTQAGLFGRPTLVHNVETLANIPRIALEGGAAFATGGDGDSTGTKLFCLAGAVARPGAYETPFGATVRELIALAGGVPGGGEPAAVLLGGAAGAFVPPDRLGLPLTFGGAREAGLPLGAGAVTVFGADDDVPGAVRRIAAFFRDESCGQCVPCRIGTVRQEEALHRLAAGTGDDAAELALLGDVGRAMTDASICGLGQTAASAVRSAIGLGLLGPPGGGRAEREGSAP